MKPEDGGGHRYISISKEEDQTFSVLLSKALDVYFTCYGKNSFNESRHEVTSKIEDATGTEVDLLDDIPSYLNERGLFPSKTCFVFKTGVSDKCDLDTNTNESDDDNNSVETEPFPSMIANVGRKRKICPDCGFTYFQVCVRCKQDAAFAASLAADQLDIQGNCQSEQLNQESDNKYH